MLSYKKNVRVRNKNQTHIKLSRELLRALRAERTQRAFSRLLGYQANPVAKWESGRAFPTAAKFLQIVRARGRSPRMQLQRFYVRPPAFLKHDLDDDALVRALLEDLCQQHSFKDLAEQTGLSRYAISRMLSGVARPQLPALLLLVEVCTHRLLDFVACFVDPLELPSVASTWQQLEAARQAAYAAPFSQAVLRAIELEDYRELPQHVPGYIAKRIGISLEEEEHYLQILQTAGQISWQDETWITTSSSVLDTRVDVERAKQTRAYWARKAVERMEHNAEGIYGYSLFSVSKGDLMRIRDAQRRYLAEVRDIVALSEPAQCIVLANTLLTTLAEPVAKEK